jgi:hypothetical protein
MSVIFCGRTKTGAAPTMAQDEGGRRADQAFGAKSRGSARSIDRRAVREGEVHLQRSAAGPVLARGPGTLDNAGCGPLLTSGDVSISRGGCGPALAGVVIGRNVELRDGSRVLMSRSQAAAFGVALGPVVAAASGVMRARGRG